MPFRDVPGSSRCSTLRRVLAVTGASALVACAPPNMDVVTASLCVSPASAADAAALVMQKRINDGDYGKVSAQRFGAKYIDLADAELRARASCCGKERMFKECAAGSTPVDLIVDVRRKLTPEETEQLRRQLAAELDAALEIAQP